MDEASQCVYVGYTTEVGQTVLNRVARGQDTIYNIYWLFGIEGITISGISKNANIYHNY